MRNAVLSVAAFLACSPVFAAVPALDVSDATEYLETNGGTAMIAIATVLLTLAGLGVVIKWAKATFFG